MRFNRNSNSLQAFAAKCLVRLIVNEEDPQMRALYREYLKELEAMQKKSSDPCPVFVSHRSRLI